MFGKKIQIRLDGLSDWIKRIIKSIDRIDTVLIDQFNHIKSLQSTNDKRYNEINTRLQNIEDSTHGIVHCDVCKCLILKKNAIRGESRIKKSVYSGFLGGINYNLVTGEITKANDYKEEVEKVYYCHKCAPKGKNDSKNTKKQKG
jgi:hypothetical protein